MIKLETKSKLYVDFYQRIKADSDFTGLGYPEKKKDFDFFCRIGDIDITYSLKAKIDLLVLEGRIRSDAPATAALAEKAIQRTTLTYVIVNDEICLNYSLPLSGYSENTAVQMIESSCMRFFTELKKCANNMEKVKRFKEELPLLEKDKEQLTEKEKKILEKKQSKEEKRVKKEEKKASRSGLFFGKKKAASAVEEKETKEVEADPKTIEENVDGASEESESRSAAKYDYDAIMSDIIENGEKGFVPEANEKEKDEEKPASLSARSFFDDMPGSHKTYVPAETHKQTSIEDDIPLYSEENDATAIEDEPAKEVAVENDMEVFPVEAENESADETLANTADDSFSIEVDDETMDDTPVELIMDDFPVQIESETIDEDPVETVNDQVSDYAFEENDTEEDADISIEEDYDPEAETAFEFGNEEENPIVPPNKPESSIKVENLNPAGSVNPHESLFEKENLDQLCEALISRLGLSNGKPAPVPAPVPDFSEERASLDKKAEDLRKKEEMLEKKEEDLAVDRLCLESEKEELSVVRKQLALKEKAMNEKLKELDEKQKEIDEMMEYIEEEKKKTDMMYKKTSKVIEIARQLQIDFDISEPQKETEDE